MELDKMLLDDFAEITHDKKEKLQDVTCYGTAVIQEGTEYVRLDAADSLTPATFAVAAHHGDRVMVMIKNHRATVIANITTPSMTLGILNVTDGIIVQGYLTTNEERTAYDDQNHYGLTFSAGGIGGYGGSGKYWYLTNAGDLYASSAEIVGNITAESGYLGSKTNGFTIDAYGIYSGSSDKSQTNNGYIVLANGDFARTINNVSHNDLRFAIGANFGVSSSGVLYASNVDISGTIKASLGEIGGFEIDSTSIHTKGVAVTVNADNSVGLSSSTFKRTIGGKERSNLKFAIGSNFGVDSTGKLYGSDIEVTGEINATSGTIGSGTNKIDIGAGSIHYLMTSRDDTTHDGFYIGTNGIAFGKGKFKVTDAGYLTSTSGSIGGWGINSNAIYRTSETLGAANGSYFGKDGLSITNKFQVDSAGKLTATGADIGGKITATDGSIAGWQIGTSAIYRGGSSPTESFNTSGVLYFGTQGLSLSDKFYVTSSGALTATEADIGGKITASSGKIGGWLIGSDGAILKLTNETTTAGTYQYEAYMNAPATVNATSDYAFVAQRKLHGQNTWEKMFGVRYDGYLLAKYGSIAGWAIGTATLSSTSGGLTTGLQVASNGSTWAIAVGATNSSDWSTAPFRISHAGALTATSATITGAITATSGKIGNFTLTSTTAQTNPGALYSGSHNSMTANNEGVFIGEAGISLGAGGKIQLGKDGSILLRNNLIIRSDLTPTSGSVQSGYGLSITNSNSNTLLGFLAAFYDGTISGSGRYIVALGTNGSNVDLELTSQETMTLRAKKVLIGADSTTSERYPIVVDDAAEFRYSVKIGTTWSDGSIEIYHSTPYIDFHFNRSTADYTYRIMEASSGTLWFSGSQSVAGNITVSTTSATVERALTVSTGNVSGAVRANNGGTGGAFGLYVSKTGNTARNSWLIHMASDGKIYLGGTSREAIKAFSGVSVSGKRITFTMLDGNTKDIDTQDTTYTFTNKGATLAWGTTSTIATVGGVDIKVTMPSNPDTTYSAGSGLTLSSTTFSLGGTITSNQVTLTRSGDNNAIFAIQNAKSGVAVRCNADGGAVGLRGIKTNNTTSGRDIWICYMDASGTPKLGTASDRRDKNVLGLIDNGEALSILRGVELINFSYKADPFETIQNGVVAQQVRDVLISNGIGYRSYMCIESVNDDSIFYDLTIPEDKVRYSIDYSKFTPILWKGWQIHDNEITALKHQINELKAEIKALKGAA